MQINSSETAPTSWRISDDFGEFYLNDIIRDVPKARSKRRSIHAPNLTDELSTAEERRLNQLGSAD